MLELRRLQQHGKEIAVYIFITDDELERGTDNLVECLQSDVTYFQQTVSQQSHEQSRARHPIRIATLKVVDPLVFYPR